MSFHWGVFPGAFSIGVSQRAATVKYIEAQAEDHKQISFEEEFKKFLAAARNRRIGFRAISCQTFPIGRVLSTSLLDHADCGFSRGLTSWTLVLGYSQPVLSKLDLFQLRFIGQDDVRGGGLAGNH